MTPHGPDASTFEGTSNKELTPEYFDGGLAFIFETCFQLKVSKWALGHKSRDQGYIECWNGLQDQNPHEQELARKLWTDENYF